MGILMLKVVFVKNEAQKHANTGAPPYLPKLCVQKNSPCQASTHKCPPCVAYSIAFFDIGVMGRLLSHESASVLNQWLEKSAHKSSIISQAARQNINTAGIASTTPGIA